MIRLAERRTARARVADVDFYVITGLQTAIEPLEAFLARAIGAGVGMVQLREKHVADATLLEAARCCAQVCRALGGLFIVNDRPDIALAAGAHGVHLGQDDVPVDAVRELVGPDLIVGLSTHSQEQIDAAQSLPVDYIGVGPVHETPTKIGRAAVGLRLIGYAAAHSAVPFFAIGGVDEHTIGAMRAAGARRVSVLRAVTQAENPERMVKRLRELLHG